MLKTLSLIIPCYNEEESLELFLTATQAVETAMSDQLVFDYLFVNDGSSDGSLDLMRQLAQQVDNVHYLSFSRNFGKEAAILAGLEASQGDLVTVIDADLQHPPQLLIQMYDRLTQGDDVVVARRSNRTGEPAIRSWLSKSFYSMINLISETEMVSGATDYRLMTRQVVDSILELKEVNRFSKGLFSWVGYQTSYLDYENQERVAGQTSWNFWSLFNYSIDAFVNFSEAPLNFATFAGFVSFTASLLGIVFVILRKLLIGVDVSGWTSMMAIILFVGGLQLVCLGIIGKYIAKVFLETKKRPAYIIKEKG